MKPLLVINYKAYYPHSFGKHAAKIAESAKKVYEELNGKVDIVLAPPPTEISNISRLVAGSGVRVFAQHADPIEPGAYTGFLPLEGVKEAGAAGVILNHSEHKLKLADMAFLVKRAKKLGLETLVCADEPETGAAVAALSPTYVAVEPPELIGTGVSVSKAKPDVIVKSVELIKRVNSNVVVLTGAGISVGGDVYLAIKLGTAGVLVASAIVKASDPYAVIKDMAISAVKAVEELERQSI